MTIIDYGKPLLKTEYSRLIKNRRDGKYYILTPQGNDLEYEPSSNGPFDEYEEAAAFMRERDRLHRRYDYIAFAIIAIFLFIVIFLATI